MNAWTKTSLYLIIAAGLTATVYLTRPAPREVALLSDVGKPLAPALTDPLAVKALEVISYDAQAAKVKAFKVAFDGQRWVIPSHNNYPADAAERIGMAASVFTDLVRERIVTDNKADHARLGVLSPEDESALATNTSGIGTRVTLRDGSDRPLVDLILGANVEGPENDMFSGRPPKIFVREINSDRVYVTTLAQGFSTRFIDWVETDLLRMGEAGAQSVVSVFVDRYSVDDQTMQIKDVQRVTLTRPGIDPERPTAPRAWTMSTEPGGGLDRLHTLNVERIDQLLSGLTSMRLVGVRRKPENLAAVLAGASSGKEASLSLPDQLSLQTRGFYLGRDARMLAGDGQMTVRSDDGVVYMLWFGSAVPEGEDAASGGQIGGPTGTKTDETGVPRYVLITALFDPTLLPEPVKTFQLITAEAAAAGKPEDSPEAKALAPLKQAFDARVEAWRAKMKSGGDRAKALSSRFADWYYVVDGKGLDALRPTRDQLQKPPPKPNAIELPGGMKLEPVDAPPFSVQPEGNPAPAPATAPPAAPQADPPAPKPPG
jgi:hypothetical protein